MTLKRSIAALAAVAAIALTGCTGADSSDDPGDGASLTIAKPDGAVATENNNPWVADASAVKLGYINAIMEPLAFVNVVDPSAEIRPWLASEVTWAGDFTALTVVAKDDVTWSDGEDFSAEDIEFTFSLIAENPELDSTALDIVGVERAGDSVTIRSGKSMYAKQDKVLHKHIVPKHVWEDVEDPATYDNPEPVGTGPYALTRFDTQSVELTSREDYWGGEVAVPTLYYVSYNDNTALTTALGSGDADWAQAFIPNVQSAYVGKDPEHNVYWAASGLGIDALYVNTHEKPFDDIAFRRAMNLVIDREKHAAIAREGGVPTLTSVTGLPTPVGDAFISPEYDGAELSVDVDEARSVLEQAGYSWKSESLVDPEGEEVTFELSVPQGWNDYVTGISLIADAASTLGATATIDTPDPDSWWERKSTGDFQAIIHWTDTGATPYDLYSDLMDGRWLEPFGESADYNFGRYENAEATAALAAYADASDDATRARALEKIQRIFVEEVPALPIGTRPFIGSYNTRNYVGWPSEDDPYAPADPTAASAVLVLSQLRPVD